MKMPKLSILIVNYNTVHMTIRCIQSIIDNVKECDYEIIIIDNASSDSSVSEITSRFPNVNVIANTVNLGFGKANNIGAAAASGEWLLFLNSDCIIRDDSVSVMLDYAARTDNLGTCGCNLTDSNGRNTISYGYFPSPIQEIRYLFSRISSQKYGTVSDRGQSALIVDYVSGADMLIRKEIFDKVSGFDERFFLYYEETDLQKRLSKIGLKRVIITNCSITHLEGGSFEHKGLSFQRFMYAQDSYNKYIRKHFSYFKLMGYRIFLFIWRVPNILFRPWTLKEKYIALKKVVEN